MHVLTGSVLLAGSGALSESGSAQDSKQQLMAAIARAVFLKQARGSLHRYVEASA